ncbi:MAG: fructose-bisphosphate aldolase [Gammaproteobacteria bacterium]|nr:MAG: fructose-bisphosphate aldolase [Gammaproteobacteria bacterium]
MPLVDMHDMLNHAYRNSYAVGGFDLVSLDFLEAILQVAENCRSPVILSMAESHFEHYDFELAMAATEKAARRATVPVAIHLDRGASHESTVRAINLGCNGVMVDASHESFPVNVARTRRLVEMAHACGVAVEGELGQVAGSEGQNGYTPVEEARAFVARTGVDCLMVAIGATTGHSRGKSKPDCERLKRINDAVQIPLAIRAGGSLTEDQYRKLISHGVAKIDYDTVLADIAGARLRANARAGTGDYAGLMEGVRESVRAEAERCLRLWGSAGRAAEVLVQCRPWRPVQHVIAYNVEGVDAAAVGAMMARGREVLAKIPGVRRVFAGWALSDKPRFRCCWLVEFAHAQVIASYRDHPEHVAFANQLFRPIAGDRISLDFAEAGDFTETTLANGAQLIRA